MDHLTITDKKDMRQDPTFPIRSIQSAEEADMQGSKLTFNHGSCTSKSIICYVETSTDPCVSYYTSVSPYVQKIHKKNARPIHRWDKDVVILVKMGLELFTLLNGDFKFFMYELSWLSTGLLPATGYENLCAFFWHSSFGW